MNGEGDSGVWSGLCGAHKVGEGGFGGGKRCSGGRMGGRRCIFREAWSGLGLIFSPGGCRAGLGADGFFLLLAKPGGGIDIRWGRRRGGFSG